MVENQHDEADYLPFKKLTSVNGNTNNRTVKKAVECLFTRNGDISLESKY